MTQGTKSELIQALELIEREKGVPKDEILAKLQEAVASALRKHVGKNAVIECVIDPETAHITAFQVKKVVETVADPELEMTLAEAKRVKSGVEVGEDLRFSIDTEDFARIAAQTSKQVLVQFLREKERDKLFEEFKPKEGEMVSGNVHRFMERSIIIDLGKTEGILPPREQIRRERYNGGDRLRAVILKVDKAQRGPQVLLSRASPSSCAASSRWRSPRWARRSSRFSRSPATPASAPRWSCARTIPRWTPSAPAWACGARASGPS